MSQESNTIAKMIAALTICVGQTARAVSEVLTNENLAAEDRRKLRADIAKAITASAAVLDEARPGAGEILTRFYAGKLSPEDLEGFKDLLR